jgi:membrane protease YdiL (CAAX protease family)
VLHVGPSRRLWAWPVLALAMGLAFGVVYSRVGYPGCAAAHIAVNLVGLLRLRGQRGVGAGNGAGDRVGFG